MARKPNGYWKSWGNVKSELESLIIQFGHFPKRNELRENGYFSLLRAMYFHHHGGLVEARKILGYSELRKPNGYWRDWNNVKTGLQLIIQKLGHFPSQRELIKLGNGNLNRGIMKHHGGFPRVRELMEYEPRKEKPMGYWKNWDHVEVELTKIIQKLGHFPTQKDLYDSGYSSLISAISRHHNGLLKVKELMGYGNAVISSKSQFLEFLTTDETARNLAAVALSVNGFGHDVEQILTEIYDGKFRDQESLHNLLEESTNELYDLIQNGITNLGYFIGGFSLQDRTIIPVLLGDAVNNIPEEKLTPSLEDKLVRLLRSNYSPRFNESQEEVITELREKVESSTGPKKRLYEVLQSHYLDVLRLQEELN